MEDEMLRVLFGRIMAVGQIAEMLLWARLIQLPPEARARVMDGLRKVANDPGEKGSLSDLNAEFFADARIRHISALEEMLKRVEESLQKADQFGAQT